MRSQVLYSILGMAALLVVGGCQKQVLDPPSLKLDMNEFTAPASGGEVEVPYVLKNGTEGAEVSVDPVEDYAWVTGTRVESSSIYVTVTANDTETERTAKFTVSYPGITKALEFSITQDAGSAPAPDYDYESVMTHFYMEFYEGEGYGGEDEYIVCISDISLASQDFEPGGTYYQFDIYVPAGSGTILTGNYPVGAPGETAAMTVSQDTGLTFYRYEGDPGVKAALVEGSLSVSAEGDIYTFDAVMTDEFGDVHHVSYTGSIEPEPAPEPIPGECDYEHEPAVCELEYDADYGDNGEDRYYHLVLLAENDQGYSNLMNRPPDITAIHSICTRSPAQTAYLLPEHILSLTTGGPRRREPLPACPILPSWTSPEIRNISHTLQEQ